MLAHLCDKLEEEPRQKHVQNAHEEPPAIDREPISFPL